MLFFRDVVIAGFCGMYSLTAAPALMDSDQSTPGRGRGEDSAQPLSEPCQTRSWHTAKFHRRYHIANRVHFILRELMWQRLRAGRAVLEFTSFAVAVFVVSAAGQANRPECSAKWHVRTHPLDCPDQSLLVATITDAGSGQGKPRDLEHDDGQTQEAGECGDSPARVVWTRCLSRWS